MAKSKPYQAPLAPELADEILSIPLPESWEGVSDRPLPKTHRERLAIALEELRAAVADANAALADHQVAGIVASSLARDLNKRGNPAIVVAPDGTPELRITYEEDRPNDKRPRVMRGKQVGKWHSDLPRLAQLREEAAELGVDIEDLGRQRKAIHQRLQEARSKLRHHDEVKVSPLGGNGAGLVPNGDTDTPPKAPSRQAKPASR